MEENAENEWPKLSPFLAYPAVCGVNSIQWENCLETKKPSLSVCGAPLYSADQCEVTEKGIDGGNDGYGGRKPGRTETWCHRMLWFLVKDSTCQRSWFCLQCCVKVDLTVPHANVILTYLNKYELQFTVDYMPKVCSVTAFSWNTAVAPHCAWDPASSISLSLCYSQPQSSRAVRRCTTLIRRTRESWASARAISSPWPIRSTRTGTRECWTASRDSSLSTMSRSSFRCHTNTKRAREPRRKLMERRSRRRRREHVELVEREESEVKGWSAEYSFSASAPASTSQMSTFLSSGVLEKMVTFQSPDQNINLFHLKVKGSKMDTKCHYSLSGSQKHFLRTNDTFISNIFL